MDKNSKEFDTGIKENVFGKEEVSELSSNNIKLCNDGKYRWVYEMVMLKNPVFFLSTLRIILIGACAPAILTTLFDLNRGLKAIQIGLQTFGITLLIMIPVLIIAYIVLVIMYGGKYIVLFEMDDNGIVHIQQDKQFKKAQAIAWLDMFSGVATNSFGNIGTGILISQKNSQITDFKAVKTIRGIKNMNTIKIGQPFGYNQVYVDKNDYDFVFEFIKSHCKDAKIK